jgi:hypothetical protein
MPKSRSFGFWTERDTTKPGYVRRSSYEAIIRSGKKKLADHLAWNPKTCGNWGSTEWTFGEVQVNAADLVGDSQKVPVGGDLYVDLKCNSCGEPESVDCDEAGLEC